MKSYSLKLKALLFLASLLSIPNQGVAQTVVNSTANSGSGTLRNAVINSSAGDTITFSPTLLANGSDTITLTSDIILYHGLVFQGINTATDTLYIDGNKQTRLFYLSMGNTANKNVVFENMAFINGKPIVANPVDMEHGGAIRTSSTDSLIIRNCVFRENETFNGGDGGAVYAEDTYIEIFNCSFEKNKGVVGNPYVAVGGALCVESATLKIESTVFNDNEASFWGGAVITKDSDVRCVNSVFINNSVSSTTGGAVSVTSGTAYFGNTLFKGNSSPFRASGLAIWNYTSDPMLQDTVVNCIFDSNTLTGTGFSDGRGALNVEKTVVLNTVIKNNSSNRNCAGVYANNSQLINCSVVNNTAASNNVAIDADDCVLRNTTISGNISQNGNHTIKLGGNTVFRNVTVTGNSQDDEAIGSGIGDTLVISNSIVCGNGQYWYEDGIDVSTLISGGYNIIRNNPTGTVSTDHTNYNSPLNLEPLGLYGGTTPTMPPMKTSAAYNAGDPTKFQRAQNGPVYGRRDIGAAEHRHIVTDTTLGCGSVAFWGTTYNSPGTYFDTVSNTNSLDSVGILVLTGLDSAVVNNSGVLISQDTNAATTFQWVDCNNNYAPVSGAVSSTFVPTQNGTYALILNNGNCTDTSSCYQYNEVGVEEHTKQSLHFYPNPASNQLTIVTHGPLPNRLQIVDLTGRLVRSIQVEYATVNLPAITGGVYLLQWVFEDGTIQVDRVIIH
jgi:hypothetical protein